MPNTTRFIGVALGLVALFTLTACNPEVMSSELERTYNARQCIIDHESREAGMYLAENSTSTASGAYQWLNSSWAHHLDMAEKFYGIPLLSPEEEAAGARFHAAAASPYVQDVVTAYTLVHRPQNSRPWTYRRCWNMVGSDPILRDDGPQNSPSPYLGEIFDAIASNR